MRSFFWCLTLLTVGLIACQTERPPTAEPIAIVLTATPSPTATGTASHTPSPTTTLTNTPRPTRTPTNTPTVTPTFTPYPTPLPTATPAPTLPASSCQLDLTLVAQTGGEATGLALSEDGRLAYITVGPRLQVYDVADRANPTLQWQSDVFRQRFVDLAVVGEFGFGRLVDGWVVWRMSAVPELLWESPAEPITNPDEGGNRPLLALANTVYLGLADDQWLGFDLLTPRFPLQTVTQLGNIVRQVEKGWIVKQSTTEQTTFLFVEGETSPTNNVLAQLALDGQRYILSQSETYLYIMATTPENNDGLIVDISDFAQPRILSNELSISFPVTEYGNIWIGNDAVYDISDPLLPRLLTNLDDTYLLFNFPMLVKDEKILFIHGWSSTISLMNLSNPGQFRFTKVTPLPPLPFVTVEPVGEDTLFVLQPTQLTILDIADLTAITEIGRANLLGSGWGAVLTENNIIAPSHDYGFLARQIPFQIFDQQTTIDNIPLDTASPLYLHQNTLFTAWEGGVVHYHLPTQQLYRWPWEDLGLTDGFSRFASYGEYMIVIDDKKLVVIDLGEPSQPVIIGRYDSSRMQDWTNSLEQMRLINSVAFIASRYELTAVDLTNPTQPQEIGHWPMDESISSLFSIGEVLYVGGGNGNTLVFDVSTPTEPRLVQTIGAQLNGHLYGDFLIGDDYIYDVADPLNPLLVGETGIFGRVIGIRDNLLYVGSEAGVYVYEIGVRP